MKKLFYYYLCSKIMTDKEKIAELESQLADALAKIAELSAELTTALEKISELESLLSKFMQKKTSKNSHVPPSSDLSRKNQSLREKSNKPVGGQVGHEGSTLDRIDNPDKIVDLRADYCNSCGKSLEDSETELLSSLQVIDIPPIIPVVTDYRCFGTKCSCRHVTKGQFPQGVECAIQYGPNVQSLAIYQNIYQFIPFKRLQDFFKNVCNLPISKGTIEYPITAPEFISINQRLDQLLKLTVLQTQLDDPVKHKETIPFFAQMIKLKKGLFTFLQHQNVPFDNNASERAIRNVKVKIKVSGQFKSLQNEFAIETAVIDTATKNGQSIRIRGN